MIYGKGRLFVDQCFCVFVGDEVKGIVKGASLKFDRCFGENWQVDWAVRAVVFVTILAACEFTIDQ